MLVDEKTELGEAVSLQLIDITKTLIEVWCAYFASDGMKTARLVYSKESVIDES